MTIVMTCPGDWNHPYLLLRLLEVVGSTWQLGEGSRLVDSETGMSASLAYSPPVDGLRQAFEQGSDLTRPAMTESFLDALDTHNAVFQVQVPADQPDALEVALRAANAVCDGGALGVHLLASGLAHEADAYQALMRGLDDGTDRHRALMALVVRYEMDTVSTTVGMASFGKPDFQIEERSPDVAVAKLERAALAALDGKEFVTVPDERTGVLPNPHGIAVL